MPGRPQYAPPPPGTYAPPSQLPSTSQSFIPPSVPVQSSPVLNDGTMSGSFSSMMSPAMTPPSSHGEAPINYGPPPQNYSSPPTGYNPPPASSTFPTSVPGNAPSPLGGAGLMPTDPVMPYIPVKHHWFYSKHVELRQMWEPFSLVDSNRLEEAFKLGKICVQSLLVYSCYNVIDDECC